MRTVGFRASRGFWRNGAHVMGGSLILVTAKEGRQLQKAGKGKMILTRYPGRLDRGPASFNGAYAFEGDQVYVRPDEKAEGFEANWTRKDDDCEPCPKKAAAKAEEEAEEEKPKKKPKRKKKEPEKKKE